MNDKEYELLEYVFQLAYSSAYSEEIKEISDLENKIIKKLESEDKAIDLLEEARENIDLPWYDRQHLIEKTINELRGEDKE